MLAGKAALDEELKQLREEFAAARKANSVQPDTHDYTETETRNYFIDLLLKEAGWELDGKNFEIEVSGMLASTPLSQRDFETGRQSEADRSSLEVSTWFFFKIVRSKTRFWQMLGSGTRLRLNLFGSGKDKELFYIFDYCQNLEFFSQKPDHSDGSASEPLSTRLFKARLEIIAELDKKVEAGRQVSERAAYQLNEAQLRTELADFLHQHVAAMNLDNFVVSRNANQWRNTPRPRHGKTRQRRF